MCPNTEFFLVRIFPPSGWIQTDTKYLSVFSPNVGKYGPEKTPYMDTFYAFGIYPIYDFFGEEVMKLRFRDWACELNVIGVSALDF